MVCPPCLVYTAEESSNKSNDNAVRYSSAAGYSDNHYWTVSCVGSGRRTEEGGTARRQHLPPPPRRTEPTAATKRQRSGDQRPNTTHTALPFTCTCVPVGRHPGLCLLVTAPSAQHNTTQHNTTQHNTTQHNTTQHNTTQHNTTQHSTAQHNTSHHTAPQCNTTGRDNITQHSTTHQCAGKSNIHQGYRKPEGQRRNRIRARGTESGTQDDHPKRKKVAAQRRIWRCVRALLCSVVKDSDSNVHQAA